jgi:hypothetical protein
MIKPVVRPFLGWQIRKSCSSSMRRCSSGEGECARSQLARIVVGWVKWLLGRQSIPTFVPGHRLSSGPIGTMGVGLPFAVGAKAAKPSAHSIPIGGSEVRTWRSSGLGGRVDSRNPSKSAADRFHQADDPRPAREM